ncbi:MAG: L,D-transpeptidase family protein [Candidatus Paceibacterota bacterium]
MIRNRENFFIISLLSLAVLATFFWFFFYWGSMFNTSSVSEGAKAGVNNEKEGHLVKQDEEKNETDGNKKLTDLAGDNDLKQKWYQDLEDVPEKDVVETGEEDKEDEEDLGATSTDKELFQYIKVTGSCGPYFNGECLNVRAGPGTDHPIVGKLRNGQILKVEKSIERQEHLWYKIEFNEWLRYPDRSSGDWYVAADHVEAFFEEGSKIISSLDPKEESNIKLIVVERGGQKLYAYESDELVMEYDISTGLNLTPTPRGEFVVFKKTPSRYMQGPIPGISLQYWDLPGVPWNLYFTEQGAVVHGAYWHESFGRPYSNGCVNMRPEEAEELYHWAELGTEIIVRD